MKHDHPVLHRYALALRIPGGAAFRIDGIRRRWSQAIHPVPMEHLQIVLARLEDSVTPLPDGAAALRAVAADVHADPFELALDRIEGGTRAIALAPSRTDRLRRLQQHVAEAMAQHGVAPHDGWRFHPRAVIGYRPGEPFHAEITPIGMRAAEIVLVHSQAGGRRQELLGRWPLLGERQMELALL